MLTNNISDSYSNKYMKIKIDSGDDLPLEKKLNMHNVIVLTKSGFDRNYNHCCYQVFLEKCSYK